MPDIDSNQIAKTKIRETLLRLGAIKAENIELFSPRTRDCDSLKVYQDSKTKVIFIDEYYVGDKAYAKGIYRGEIMPEAITPFQNYEDCADSERRLAKYKQFIVGKRVCDFGCGAGSFLKLAKVVANHVVGIELQQNYSDSLNSIGIPCFGSLNQVEEKQDVISLFHCFEHLPNPSIVLKDIYSHLKPAGKGKILIEVPHARDFLIGQLSLQSFINSTLWSQHLILHTRDSLTLMLEDAGFKNIHIEGVQRYSLANHFLWMINGKPGGHKEALSVFETPSLVSAYSEALSKIDANDTLVAVANT